MRKSLSPWLSARTRPRCERRRCRLVRARLQVGYLKLTKCATRHVLQAAHYVMGIVHGEASYLPDFLDYFSTKFPSAPVKMEILGKKDIETTTMVNFYSQVSRKHNPTRKQRIKANLRCLLCMKHFKHRN